MAYDKLFPSRHGMRTALAAALTMAAVSAACDADDPAGPEGSAAVRVLLTDAPTDMLDSAHVWISRVYLVGAGGDEVDTDDTDALDDTADKLDLYNDAANPLRFDLLLLRDGVTADLTGEVPVEATTYQGLRFVVDSARVTLKEGLTFEDGSRIGTMKVPSGQQSGIKVKLNDILDPAEGEVVTVTVDFDVDENFNIQMGNQTDEVRRILFKPVLKEKARGRN